MHAGRRLAVLLTAGLCACATSNDADGGADGGHLDAGSLDGGADGGGGTDAGLAVSGSITVSPETTPYLTYHGGKALFVLELDVQPPGATATLEATASGGALSLELLPSAAVVGPGVRELLVTPASGDVGSTQTITLRLSGAQPLATTTVRVQTTSWRPPTPIDAERDAIVDFLAAQHPELGVTRATGWQWWGEVQALVVAHHLYLSDRGALFLSRHVTIPPNDWVKATFRPRQAARVTWAGQIDSSSASLTVHDEPVPDAGR